MPQPNLPITQLGNPILRQKALPITREQLKDIETRRLITNIKKVLKDSDDLGLAANQINQIVSLFAVNIPPKLMGHRTVGVPLQVIINPKIIERSKEIIDDWEGCLSFNYLRGRVPRHQQVVVEAWNEQGESITIEAYDIYARVLQHEIDHLEGILYLDRMTDLKSLMGLEEFRERNGKEMIVE
ncbi:peptide deformylase [Patescibacteria group bacterium]|nr:peptide deformylase [Patescibacteria group bacterium]